MSRAKNARAPIRGVDRRQSRQLKASQLRGSVERIINDLQNSETINARISGSRPREPVRVADASVANGTITINPSRTGGDFEVMSDYSAIQIPNTVKADGFRYGQGILTHAYVVLNKAPAFLKGRKGLLAIEKALIADPTPGQDNKATKNGTLNDVGDITFLDGDDNFVRSFVVRSRDPRRSASVVNYTVKGEHLLHEGFVLRFAKLLDDNSILLVNYGEGDALIQSYITRRLWEDDVKAVWTENAQGIFSKAVGE